MRQSTSNYAVYSAKKSQVQVIRDEMYEDRSKNREHEKRRASAVKPAANRTTTVLHKQESNDFVREEFQRPVIWIRQAFFISNQSLENLFSPQTPSTVTRLLTENPSRRNHRSALDPSNATPWPNAGSSVHGKKLLSNFETLR